MPDITAPNAQAYGTYEQALAQMLAGGGQVAGPLNALALNSYAREQRGQYGLALQRTQQMQQQQAQEAYQAELQKQYIASLPALTAAGGAGILPSDQVGLNTYLPAIQTSDNSIINAREADAFKANTGGIANLADIGYGFTPAATSELALTGRIQGEEDQDLMPYMTPDQTTDRQNADTKVKEAETNRISVNRPRSSGGGGGSSRMSLRYVPDGFGDFEPALTMNNVPPELVNRLMPGVIPGMGGATPAPTNPFARMTLEDAERQVKENEARRNAERR